MDNVTHSLIGALVAEGALASIERPGNAYDSRARTLALVTSIVSNNLPDFDFAYRRITPGKLGYLLHHRGHTHTLPGALALGALAFVAALGWARWRSIPLVREERRVLGQLALFGPFIHVALDYGNNYGVHPFWPVDDRWFYGDAMFIVEPLLWAVTIPPLIVLSQTRTPRYLMAALFGAGLWIAGARVLSISDVVAVVTLFGAMVGVCVASRRERRAAAGIAGWLAVTATFAIESRAAKARARAASESLFSTTRVVDIVTTPRPADPFCWSVLVLGTDGDRYVARRGRVSTAPWRRNCVTLDGATSTAPLRILTVADRGLRFEREFSAPVGELRTLAKNDCRAAAFLRFARAPFWTTDDDAPIVGDLRFDRSRALDFTDLKLSPADSACPRYVPPWKPPRADVLP